MAKQCSFDRILILMAAAPKACVFFLIALLLGAFRFSTPAGSVEEKKPDVVVNDEANGVYGQKSTMNSSEGLPWNEKITATYYGASDKNLWGGYGNRLYSSTDYFCALPASHDNLDCLNGSLACRIERCGIDDSIIEELLSEAQEDKSKEFGQFEFWPGSEIAEKTKYGWVVEGREGDGLFRVLEIKKTGTDGPIYELYVGDVGPWGNDDPYWEDLSRPNSEERAGTNRAGIDLSYALAKKLGSSGLIHVDWRWKTVEGAYVVQRRVTEWRR
jgi:hypothetical protein